MRRMLPLIDRPDRPRHLFRCAILGLALLGAGSARAGELLLSGAGATFPFPLYSKWFAEYGRQHPGVKFNYQSNGSGGGIKQITERTVDFGATDVPMTPEEE